MQNSKPIVGLIGGIGSGKSRVADAFARHGGRIVAGDPLGHEALRQPDILARVAGRWGQQVLDQQGQVNRRKLGEIVFAVDTERLELERLVFPFITQRINEEVARVQVDSAAAFVVLDAAVMLEAGWNKVCDLLVYVDVPRATRLERLRSQRGWTEIEIAQREQAQWPLEQKKALADHVIDNSGSESLMERRVAAIVGQLHG